VVGGGGVAERKVETLLEYGARVKVISPKLSAELKKMAAKEAVEAEERQYRDGDLAGAFVVVAATDNNEVNGRVSREARKLGLLINVVDDAARSNFIVPSSLRRGDIIVAISTSGASPALARKLRTELEERFGEEYATLAKIAGEVRRQLISSGKAPSPEKWQQALDTDYLIGMIKDGREKEARAALLSRLRQD
jgi:siroheme synthase-like protein